jgi:putative ABC transport system permease protein
LAAGIGTSTTIISAVNPILFEPLPYPQPERIVSIWDYGVDASHLDVTFGTFREISERNRTLDSTAVMRAWQPTITGSEQPERLEGQRVSAKYFDVLAVLPIRGRTFTATEDLPNAPRVAILSDRLWHRRFNGDPSIIGRDITLDDDRFAVVGIMPPTFENVLSPSVELWTTLQYNPAVPLDGREWGHHLRMIARVHSGESVAAAAADLGRIALTPIPEFARAPWAALGQGLIVGPLKDDVVRAVRPALLAILGAVAVMLLIVCVNVTNLMLARGAQRKGELAVRAALGAGRVRMIRHLLTESLLITGFGGALGTIVADFGLQLFVALAPSTLPRATAMQVDYVTLGFGVAITIVVGVAVGVIPAFRASAAGLPSTLQGGSTRVAGDHQSIRRVLVVAEVALAIVLLVSAGLLMRSVQRLFAISPGFEPAHLLTMQVQTSGRRFDKAATERFFEQALESVRRVPGVTRAAFTSQLPLSGDSSEYGVLFENPGLNAQGGQPAFRYSVSPGYIETIGIPLRRGRLLESRDDAAGPRVALVSESLARKIAGADPIGTRIRIGWSTDMQWYTIVGVVGDVKQSSLLTERADAVYTTPEQWTFADNPMSFVIRTRDRAAMLTPEIRRAIWAVDKDQPIMRVAMMERLVADSAAERRFALILFQAFSVVALLLAALGIYGVLATSVIERTREIGVRSALGATRTAILALVLRQGLSLTALGAAIGLAGGLFASRGLATLLFNTSRFDPLTYSGVLALLVSVAVLACWIPAWRAARVDPSVALRSD